jgi:hypothetical protein
LTPSAARFLTFGRGSAESNKSIRQTRRQAASEVQCDNGKGRSKCTRQMVNERRSGGGGLAARSGDKRPARCGNRVLTKAGGALETSSERNRQVSTFVLTGSRLLVVAT